MCPVQDYLFKRKNVTKFSVPLDWMAALIPLLNLRNEQKLPAFYFVMSDPTYHLPPLSPHPLDLEGIDLPHLRRRWNCSGGLASTTVG
jgi:hypothetical protein